MSKPFTAFPAQRSRKPNPPAYTDIQYSIPIVIFLQLVGLHAVNRPLVPSGVIKLVSVGRGEVVQDSGSAGTWNSLVTEPQQFNRAQTVRVLHGDDLLVLVKVVQQRREDSPAGVELIVTNKVGVVSLESVKNERLVRLGDLEVAESAAVGEVKLGDGSLHAKARQLRVHLDVDALVGLDADDELVAGNILEDSAGDILELDANLRLLLVESCFAPGSAFVRTKAAGWSLPFPAFRMKGTPSQRSFLMYTASAQKVGHLLSLGTVSSSK